MFVKTTKANGYTYINIVESYRDESGISRHRVLYNFGRFDLLKADQGFINCVKKLCRLLEIPLLEDREKETFQSCSEAEMLNYGYLAYEKLWERLGMRNCFASLGKDSRMITLNLEKTVMLMAVQHLLHPRSKLSTYEHQGAYYGRAAIPLHHFYRALDKLAENKEKIERELFERNCLKLGQEVDVVFYDVTTFAFQSVKRDGLRDFGFSKDCKFNEVQVVMGLLLNAEGMPMGYELFPGNTFDGKTMVASLENLRKKFNIRKVVIVADRGLNSKGNLELIKAAGYGYIMACRLRSMGTQMRSLALDETGYTAVGGDFRYKAVPYANIFKDENKTVHEMKENLVISWSGKRALKDARDRQRLIDKADKLLKSPALIEAQSKRGGRKYLSDESGKRAKWYLNSEKIEQDAKLDGYYGIQTSETELSPTEVMNAYHMLWKIEDSFRVMKSTMEVRPVFHWTPERIKGHFVMCYMAFMMERKLEALLPKPEDAEANSPERIREALNSMQLAKLETNGETIYLKTRNLPLGSQIFKALGLKTPMNVSREEQLKERFALEDGTITGQITMF
jgi:transposase